MILPAMISLALSFLALTFATPLSTRGPCKPNFGSPLGFEVSIVNKGLNKEWGLASTPPVVGTKIVAHPASLSKAEFLVRHPNGEYSIRPIGYFKFEVAATGGSTIAIIRSDVTFWDISCNQCGPPKRGVFSSGCRIKSVANPFLCAETASAIGSAVSLKPCNGGTNQIFEFVGA